MTRDRTLLGILCMIGFATIAPVMDAFAKATPAYIPVMQILAFRFGIQALALLPMAAGMRLMHRPAARECGLHLVRALLIVVATGLFFAAIRFMPIANALAIFFVAPFIITLLGGVLLGEEVGPRRLVACAIGFAGALLVIQPSFEDLGLVALFPLGTALCFAFYMIMTRRMATRIHPIALQGYTAFAACLIILPLLTAFNGTGNALLDPAMPHGLAVWTLLGVGIVSTISHLFISFALRLAPAATIAPLQYLEIVAATVLGYTVFGDFPDALTWLGIAVIVGSGLYVFMRERALQKRTIPPTSAV
ncbi:DMT family transporter [Roseovarius faecimaris]|uniref:DMT family transporter n=1 Tax=Roseovarius faecimaris TaxID=2494550 RepID=A0A6I6INE0_9RHOB|nr:DMT family transporter [Roseovarius faecimaris]QGX97027.1 DMT family transporter [Roseovarius faecimaris]